MFILIIFLLNSILNDYPLNTAQISIYLNNEPFPAPLGWIDSIASAPESAIIRYKISGAHSDGSSVITRIRLPQVLTLEDVVKQVILYYQMLDNDEARQNEALLIFPYFTEPGVPPPIRVTYQNPETIYLNLSTWQTITRPAAPDPVERDIYNQIIEDSFNDVQEYEKIPDETFKKIAQKNNISLDRIKQIYQDVILWQLTR